MRKEIEIRDLEFIIDVLKKNLSFHKKRDEMNAELHCSSDRVLYSNITNVTEQALIKLNKYND